jgi:ABC-type transport system involved in multi-copper enzyme maturation permease subunit
MRNLVQAEFVKIFKRWNVWIMLGILLFFQNIPVLIAIFGKFENASAFYLPQIFTTQLSASATSSSLTGILILIFTVSSLGGEYGWGTLRTVLVRGTSRRQFLTAKLIAVLIVLLLWFLTLLLVSLPLGWTVMKKANQEISWGFFNLSGGLVLLEFLARTYYTVLPVVILGFFWTTVGRSLGVGMGAAIVHVIIADPLMFQVFHTLGGFWAELSPYTMIALGKSVATFRGEVSPMFLSSQWLAAGVLMVYVVVFGAGALRIFQRSDIRFTAA